MNDKPESGEIVKQAITVLFGRGVIRVCQLVAFFILARSLTPGDFGWFGILTTAIALAAIIGSLGLRQSFAFEIGQGRLSAGEALGAAAVLTAPLGLLAGAVVYILYGSQLPSFTPVHAAVVIFVGVASSILLLLLQGIFLGLGTINEFTFSEAFPRFALTAIVVSLAFFASITLKVSIWVSVASYLIVLPFAIWLVVNKSDRVSAPLGRVRKMVPYGIVFALNTLLAMLCLRVSMFVIEHFDGPGAAGQFFAAVRVYDTVLEAAAAFGMVLFSNAARHSSQTPS